jgi:putative membrane protein
MPDRMHPPLHRRPGAHPLAAFLIALVALLTLVARPASAGPGDAGADSVYLIGEFVDPVCIYQHGMQGVLQRQCAMVRGRVEQGMFFLDVRHRKLYTVIGQTHWEDPKQAFLQALGDTFAVKGRVWRRDGSAAIVITDAWPYRDQPQPVFKAWPWHWEWSVLLGCGLFAVGYALAMTRLRRRLGIPLEPGDLGRAITFASSLIVILVSLNGPLHDLSDRYLFSTHMIQHLLLAQVFPLLFILGIPTWLWRWLLGGRAVHAGWSWLARVPIGFVLYTLVISIWHVAVLYDLMMREHNFHIVMHLMVMGTAVLMWWPVAGGDAVERPIDPPAQLLYLFLLGTPMMAVAAMITFAGQPLYEWYALAPRFMGMSAVEDQRLGGLIMWVPGGLFYWVVMSVVFFRWSARESRPESDPFELPASRAGAIVSPVPATPLRKER